ncbi:MAG: hypothetical protein WDZ91_11000 [Paenibacillaceae bacterium]
MHNQKDDQPTAYADLFIAFSNSVEKWLKRSIAVLFITLVAFQFLLQSSEIRYHLTTIGKLEGKTEEHMHGQ